MDSKEKRSKNSSTPTINVSAHGAGNNAAVRKMDTTIDCLPLEMLQYIFELCSNTDTLKTWRLVSRSWNDVCCQILQKVSAVPLNVGEGEEDLEVWKDLAIDRLANFPSDWPNPFKNFKVLGASTIPTNLVRFLQRPNVVITTFEIVHNEGYDLDPKLFESILEKIKGELIHLKISGNTDTAPFLTLTEKLDLGWGSLKTLTLKDTCKAPSKPCPHVEFILALKTKLRLKEISLYGELINVTRIFTGKDHCWDQLTRLELHCVSPPSNVTPEQIYEFMKWTEEISFCPLTYLAMWFDIDGRHDRTSEQYTPYFLPLVHRSSQVIQHIRIYFLPLSLLPSLPKLKSLSCALTDVDRVQDITESKFPSLTSVFCHINWTEVPTYVIPKESESNKKIVDLKIFWSKTTPAEVSQVLLWSILKDHFPNLKTINIQRIVSFFLLHVIRKRFPGLSSIHLRSIKASEILGTSSVLTEKGWPGDAYENCALLDMTELTHLELGALVTVSKEVITACLAKLSKIRYVSFIWNNSLQTCDVSEYLGHIQNVTIFYKDKQQTRQLEELTKKMKNLKLVKSPY